VNGTKAGQIQGRILIPPDFSSNFTEFFPTQIDRKQNEGNIGPSFLPFFFCEGADGKSGLTELTKKENM